MWEEILVDDIETLQKHIDVFNNMACNISVNQTIDLKLLKFILNTKTKCHCDFYEDSDRQIISLYKYNAESDRMVIFQHFDTIPLEKALLLGDKSFDIYAEHIKRILLRHNKILRRPKLPLALLEDPEWIKIYGTKEEHAQLAISENIKRGINSVEFENYWEYELM